ncbi:hypothetical protein ACI1US_02131 [Leucobacter sp. BZR 635]
MKNASHRNTRTIVIASARVAFAIGALPAGPAMATGVSVQSAAVVTRSKTPAAVALAATPWQTPGRWTRLVRWIVAADGAPRAAARRLGEHSG